MLLKKTGLVVFPAVWSVIALLIEIPPVNSIRCVAPFDPYKITFLADVPKALL